MTHTIKRINTQELWHRFDKILSDVSQGAIVVVEQNNQSSIALIPVKTDKQLRSDTYKMRRNTPGAVDAPYKVALH